MNSRSGIEFFEGDPVRLKLDGVYPDKPLIGKIDCVFDETVSWEFAVKTITGRYIGANADELTKISEEEFKQEVLEYVLQR